MFRLCSRCCCCCCENQNKEQEFHEPNVRYKFIAFWCGSSKFSFVHTFFFRLKCWFWSAAFFCSIVICYWLLFFLYKVRSLVVVFLARVRRLSISRFVYLYTYVKLVIKIKKNTIHIESYNKKYQSHKALETRPTPCI